MFSFEDLKQTRFYQEAKEEGRLEGLREAREEAKLKGKLEAKLECIPRILALGLGLTVEQIAQALRLEVAIVQQIADDFNSENLDS